MNTKKVYYGLIAFAAFSLLAAGSLLNTDDLGQTSIKKKDIRENPRDPNKIGFIGEFDWEKTSIKKKDIRENPRDPKKNGFAGDFDWGKTNIKKKDIRENPRDPNKIG